MKEGGELISLAKTKYVIDLDASERKRLMQIVNDANETARTQMRANILLASNASNEKKKTVLELADELGTTHTTVQTVRAEYIKGGIDKAVYRKERTVSTKTRKINDDVVAKIVKLAGEEPPKGCKRWSTRLLCKASEEQGIVEHISPASMLKVLSSKKKNEGEL